MSDGTKIYEPVDASTVRVTTVDSHEVDYGAGDIRDRQRVMVGGTTPNSDAPVKNTAPNPTDYGLYVRLVGSAAFEITDEMGVPYSATNPMPVSVGDLTVQQLTVAFPDSVVSTANSASTPLAAGEVFTGSWEEVVGFSAISAIVLTDAASATNGAVVEFSEDGINVARSVAATIPANVGLTFMFAPEARYFRIIYTNGPTPQTILRAQVLLHYQPPVAPQLPLGALTTDASLAASGISHLKGRAVSGAWLPVLVDSSGNLQVSGTVAISSLPEVEVKNDAGNPLTVTGPLTDTQMRAAPVQVSGTVTVSNPTASPETGLAKDATFAKDADGGIKVHVQNVPATQPVSATSLPLPTGAATEASVAGVRTDLGTDGATPPSIAGTGVRGWLRAIYERLGGTINVSQRALASGTDSVTVTGTVTSTPSGTQTVTGTIAVSSLPEVEIKNDTGNPIPVSGTVTANTGLSQPLTDGQLRASAVPVTGTVTVSNPTTNPETGLAKDVTVGRRFSASSTRLTRATTVSASGDTVIVATTSLQRLRLYWVGLATPDTNTASITVQVKIGSTVIYDWPLGAPGAFAHFEIVEGALGEDLVVTLSGAQPVKVNYTYEIF